MKEIDDFKKQIYQIAAVTDRGQRINKLRGTPLEGRLETMARDGVKFKDKFPPK